MTDFSFGPLLAYDPTTKTLLPGAIGQVFAVTDSSFTSPLAMRDLTNTPMASLKADGIGVLDEFVVADNPEVNWKSGTYVIRLSSFKGVLAQVQQAVDDVAEARLDVYAAIDILNAYIAAHPDGGGGTGTGPGGVTIHGLLSGLLADDHPQYLTTSRGDVRYATPAQASSAANSAANAASAYAIQRANHQGEQAISTITGLATALAAAVTIDRIPAGVPVVEVWNGTAYTLNGVAQTGRPSGRAETPILFLFGTVDDIPSWGQQGWDLHFTDGVVTVVGGGGGGTVDLSNYYTKTQSDARFYVSTERRHITTWGTGADTIAAKIRLAAVEVAALSGSTPLIGLDPGMTIESGTSPIEIPDGMHLAGTEAPETEFGRSCPITVRHTGASGTAAGVFCTAPPGTNDNGHKGWDMSGFTFLGTAATKFMRDNPFDASRYIAYSGFWNCHWNGMLRFYWGPAKGLWINGPGPTYFNNFGDVILYLTGSDNPKLFPNGAFAEMGGVGTYASRAVLPAMFRFGNLAKTGIGPIYSTGSPTTPMRLDGGEGGITWDNSIIEGRPNHASGTLDCAGELGRLTGGAANIRAAWYGFAMRNPSATGRTPGGFWDVSGGSHSIMGGTFQPYAAGEYPSYTRADGKVVPAGRIPPLVYRRGGGFVSVKGITRGSNALGAKPIVLTDDLNAVDCDGTVDVRLIGATSGQYIDPAN